MGWVNKGSGLLLLSSLLNFAQENPGAREVALAHSDISDNGSPFSLFNNPACLSLAHSGEIAAYYSPAPFGIKELSNTFAACCEPTKFGNLSAGFSSYGFELYRETQIALGFGEKISNSLCAGLTTRYKNISIRNYGSTGVFLIDLGLQAKINKQFSLGFVIQNAARTTINNEADQIPVVLWAGTDIKILKELIFCIAFQKELGFDPSLRLGTEYYPLEFLHIRFGVSNNPEKYAAGIGIVYQSVNFDYAVSSHPDLGLTHQFSLMFSFFAN